MPTMSTEMLPRSRDYLSPDQFIEKFIELFGQMKVRMLKFERLQTYTEVGNSSYDALMRGDQSLALRLIGENVARETDWFTRCGREDIQQVRIRAVERPLTSYTTWELMSLGVTARFGQRVLVVDITDDIPSNPLKRGSDFLIFDSSAVLAHDYDSQGLLRGAWFISDPEMVRQYLSFFEQARERSVPLGSFERTYGLASNF